MMPGEDSAADRNRTEVPLRSLGERPAKRSQAAPGILAGHLHRYERQVRAGVLEFTIGTGGEGAGDAAHTRASPGAARSLLAYGFLRIEIARTRVTYLFIDQRGRIRDRAERTITPA